MKVFLRETLDLWYWAMFCPTRLKMRMESLDPSSEKDPLPTTILFSIIDWRFVKQCLLIMSLGLTPFMVAVIISQTFSNLLFVPVILITSYSVAILLLPVGLNLPALFSICFSFLIYKEDKSFQFGIGEFLTVLSSLKNPLLGFGLKLDILRNTADLTDFEKFLVGTSAGLAIGFAIGIIVTPYAFKEKVGVLGETLLVVSGIILSILLESILITRSAFFGTLFGIGILLILAVLSSFSNYQFIYSSVLSGGFSGILTGVFTYTLLPSILPTLTASIIASVLSGWTAACGTVLVEAKAERGMEKFVATFFEIVIALIVSVIISIGISSIILGIGNLPSSIFFLTAAWMSFSFSYMQRRYLSWFIAAAFIAIGHKGLGQNVLWVIPYVFGFYYRFLPDYVAFSTSTFTIPFVFLKQENPKESVIKKYEKSLLRLPPYTSEVLWFSLPGHERLLVQIFKTNPLLAMLSLRIMQISPMPGLRKTARKALSQIIANYLSSFSNIDDFQKLLVEKEGIDDSFLPEIALASSDLDDMQSSIDRDLSVVLPRFRAIAGDIDAISQTSNIALKERGLEALCRKLNSLSSELPILGLDPNAIKRWTPVVNKWHGIIADKLEEQKKISQGELLNPFQYGNPLQRSRADLFKGRQTFAENIARILLDRNRLTIVLHGPRRCGKTSFLYNLPRLLPSTWLPIFVDVQDPAVTTDEAAFWQSLVRAIIRDSRSQGITLPKSPNRSQFIAATYLTFQNWLDEALDSLDDRQLLLNLDEFEKIGTAINEGKLSLTLFDGLRSLIQHREQLGFVFSGVQTLEELGPNWSSYFISVVPVEMLYLEPHEARELLINPDPDFSLTYASGLVEEILQITGCHPNLLQLIGAALVEKANERHTTTATADMLQAAIPHAFTLGTSYFTNVWTEFTGNPQNPTEVRVGQTLLKDIAEGSQPVVEGNELATAALRRMERYHVLNQVDGRYAFDIPLIQRWVKERAILE